MWRNSTSDLFISLNTLTLHVKKSSVKLQSFHHPYPSLNGVTYTDLHGAALRKPTRRHFHHTLCYFGLLVTVQGRSKCFAKFLIQRYKTAFPKVPQRPNNKLENIFHMLAVTIARSHNASHNRLRRHHPNKERASETRSRCVKMVFLWIKIWKF